jgi:PAS domain S-box-containing protein
MTPSPVGSGLSFRTKVSLAIAGLTLFVLSLVSVTLTRLHTDHLRVELGRKGSMYAQVLSRQLQPVVAFDDVLTAKEVFASFVSDQDVRGLAVYSSDWKLVHGQGQFPIAIPGGRVPPTGPSAMAFVSPVQSREGPRGLAYVALGTSRLASDRARAIAASLGIAGGAVLFSLLLSWLLARSVTRRVIALAELATQVAQGDLDQPALPDESKDELGQLSRAFNMMVGEIRRLFDERRQAALNEQERLTTLVGERTRELEESREEFRLVAESTNAIPFTFLLAEGRFRYVGPRVEALLGYPRGEWQEKGFLARLMDETTRRRARSLFESSGPDHEFECELPVRTLDQRSLIVRLVVSRGMDGGQSCLRGVLLDMTERRALERELAQAQKLESVGRLASGVAHEINTPVQFISDSVHFARDAATDLFRVIGKLSAVHQAVLDGTSPREAAEEASAALEVADLPYLTQNVPPALDRALEGLGRVTAIVRSMKEFAHPDSAEPVAADLNRAIESTLTIARNEYKYVADLETDFGELPPVYCHVGEFNQAILNMVVNAAHAIADVVHGTTRRGHIRVRTRLEGDDVVITLSDTGGGIPEAIRERIFDPFFTTKEVGRGTGQGLAIARSVIVDKHGGALTFTSEPGQGTTFVIRLPVHRRQVAETGMAA